MKRDRITLTGKPGDKTMVNAGVKDPMLHGNKLRSEDFNYELPQEKVAEYPVEPRDQSRMMVVNRREDNLEHIEHKKFIDLPEYLHEGDILVVNNTRVYPAILTAVKEDTGDEVQVFLLRELQANIWDVEIDPINKARIGNNLSLGEDLDCEIVDNTAANERVIRFYENRNEVQEALERTGQMPLPPYIQRNPEPEDKQHYQTVFAKVPGAVAAPSAALHFTDSLLESLREKGVETVELTLHLRFDAHYPVTISDLSRYQMQPEYYDIDAETVRKINEVRRKGGRVIAASASVARALESSHFQNQLMEPKQHWTDLFIYPPHRFTIVDGLISNFHQPQSTTLMLQSAFYNTGNMISAYKEARDRDYRFLSFGDSMLLL